MNAWDELLAYLPDLEENGKLFAYYGEALDDTYTEYDTQNEEGKSLVISALCDEYCETIGGELGQGPDWEEVLVSNGIALNNVTKLNPEKLDYDVLRAVLLYLADSLAENDDFIEALDNGYLVRIMQRVRELREEEKKVSA